MALLPWRDGDCSFMDSRFCFLCQGLELAIKEGQRQAVPKSQGRKRRLGCLISTLPVLTPKAHKHHSRAQWSNPFQVFLDPFRCQYNFGFISIPKCEWVIKMQIANSRQLKCNFLTPQPLPPEFQEELGQLLFLAAVMWYTTETGSQTGSSD